jgi:phosphotransferase system IIA component
MKVTALEQALANLQPEIATAEMLIHLGITTVEKIKAYFASKVDDDEVLAGIMLEVDSRIARRSVQPPAA